MPDYRELPRHENPPFPCHRCGRLIGSSACLDGGGPPVPGDVGVCEGCAEVWIFGDDLVGRKPGARELFDLMKSPDWQSVLEAKRAILTRRPRRPGWKEN
jgi:hypothetical protein